VSTIAGLKMDAMTTTASPNVPPKAGPAAAVLSAKLGADAGLAFEAAC